MQRPQLWCSQLSLSVADEVGESPIAGGLLQLAFTSTGVSHALIGLGQATHQLDLGDLVLQEGFSAPMRAVTPESPSGQWSHRPDASGC